MSDLTSPIGTRGLHLSAIMSDLTSPIGTRHALVDLGNRLDV
jgi:hypothetical protein